ncbi:MAG: DNA-3-methyladenine glycosylase 2 family protein [Archangium sp.]
MVLDPHACYRALRSRDARFDGRFFIGVRTTHIYCRPVCPAGRAKFENCEFFPSAAAAQEAGFRPCLRCRPETVAHLGAWRGTSNTVARALSLIAEEEPSADDSLEEIAERVGVSDRHLRRLFHEHLGASPVSVLQTRRVLFAKQLLHETRLPVSEIALASGFGSIRRFNDVFRKLFQRPPTAIRKQLSAVKLTSGVTVRLRYRAPYDWKAMLWYLRSRAIDGLERVGDDSYERELLHDGTRVTVQVRHEPKASCLAVTFSGAGVRALSPLVAKVRRVFDLDADVGAITTHLAKDPLLARLIKKKPGLRVPGAWDGFESAMRTVLGQQVTVEAGRKLVSALVAMCGKGDAFPTPDEVVAAPLHELKMPRSRQEALRAIAVAARTNPQLFDASETVEETVAKLCAVKGVGEWTAQVIALRAAREPDAFPLTDVGVLRAAGLPEKQLAARAEKWRPWRGYAAQHLWASEMTS